MIDIALLRKNPDVVGALLRKKDPSLDISSILSMDEAARSLRVNVELLRKEKNDLAAQGARGFTDELRQRSIAISKELKEKEQQLEQHEVQLRDVLLRMPNVPLESVPHGNKESNVAVKTVGEKPKFAFNPLNHVDINKRVQWFDFEAGTNMTAAQFPCYKGDGARLIYALTRIMLKNNAEHGFEPVIPPTLVSRQSLVNSSNLPKFEGDFYEVPADGLCVIPTAEVPLTNWHAGKIFEREQLPVRMTAWTSCFRREAGGYGSTERGLIRIHQFEKVELYAITDQESSEAELDRMVACAESLLNKLGLHYQISLLAGQDCSFASAKTFDIEVWLPGQDRFYEVSSCSNCTDFQARRAEIRYRPMRGEKPVLAHTLNASSLALPRLMVALMECYQQVDGTVALPQILIDEMKNLW